MSEANLQASIVDLARLFGWRVAFFRPALTGRGWKTAVGGDGAGFPDLVLLRAERMIVAELKSAKGTVTPEQRAWLNAFEGAGISAYIWRPADFPGAVKSVLQRVQVGSAHAC